MSRTSYGEVMESLMPVISSPLGTARKTPASLHLFACAMSLQSLENIGQQPGRRVWCLVLESTVLPPRVLETIAQIRQVWVPTRFCYGICAEAGVDPNKLRVVPYFLPPPRRDRKLPAQDDPFTVLVSWDAKSSINRKNILGSIEAFRQAFPEDRGVRLRLKTRDAEHEQRQLLQTACGGDTRIDVWDQTVAEVDDIYDGAHALLHLHRAEGFGRHIIEAQMRGLPVIATAYSGCMDWLTPKNSLLVDYDLVDTAQHEFQYPQGGKWAQPRLISAIDALRRCREQYSELSPMLEQAKVDAHAMVSFDKSQAAMRAALIDLELGHPIGDALLS